jgi:hypothetical protein
MPRAAYRKRQGFDEAVQKCATKAKSIDKGLVIASREEVRLTDAVKELLQKKVTTYGRYLKQVEYVGDRGLVLLLALALGKSALFNMKNEDKNRIPGEMKNRSYKSEALTALVERYFDRNSNIQSGNRQDDHTPPPQEGEPMPLQPTQQPAGNEMPPVAAPILGPGEEALLEQGTPPFDSPCCLPNEGNTRDSSRS